MKKTLNLKIAMICFKDAGWNQGKWQDFLEKQMNSIDTLRSATCFFVDFWENRLQSDRFNDMIVLQRNCCGKVPMTGGSLPNQRNRLCRNTTEGRWCIWQTMRPLWFSLGYWHCWYPLEVYSLHCLPFSIREISEKNNAHPVCQRTGRLSLRGK